MYRCVVANEYLATNDARFRVAPETTCNHGVRWFDDKS